MKVNARPERQEEKQSKPLMKEDLYRRFSTVILFLTF